jgi:transglutaminase/protease-like cytokinesis protein 3
MVAGDIVSSIHSINFFTAFQSKSLRKIPAQLAQSITAASTTELQKVSAIFRWITDNISYRTAPINSYRRNGSPRHRQRKRKKILLALKPLNERVAEEVLKVRSGVCNGYRRLFYNAMRLCGIRSEIITGYAKTNGK